MVYIAVVAALLGEDLREGGARASRRAEVLRRLGHDEHRDGRPPESAVGYAAEEESPRAARAAGPQRERKLPRQVDTTKVDFAPDSSLGRNVSGESQIKKRAYSERKVPGHPGTRTPLIELRANCHSVSRS